MLSERYERLAAPGLFVDAAHFRPYPPIGERDAWEAVSPELRQTWLALAEAHIDYAWPAAKMEHYMALKRTGEINPYMFPHWERRSALGAFVLAECLEGAGRFMNQIVNGIFAICEETSWMPPVTNTYLHKVNPDELLPDAADHVVELSSAETAALLAWTYYLLGERLDAVSLRIGQRIEREVRVRVLEPYMNHNDYWWMGFVEGARVNNWNPWCNSNVLLSLLVLERDERKREAGIARLLRSLDAFIGTYSPDGCCDEGPMYWNNAGGSLYDCLELLDEASAGKLNVFAEPLVQDIGRYLYRVHIHDDYCVNFADGDAKAGMNGDVVFGYGSHIGDERLMRLGASIPRRPVKMINWFSLYRYTRDLFQEQERRQYGGKAPYVRDAWMASAQVMTAREREGSERGFFLAAKGGHNYESHNHNDVGHFIVYADGLPVLIDLGTEYYTIQTFGPRRYELWYVQSAYHNLPTVRGVMQHDGRSFRAKDASYRQTDACAELRLDMAGAYPEEAGIASWRRTFRLLRGEEAAVEIVDDYALNGATDDWYVSLMTVCEPEHAGAGSVVLAYAPGKKAALLYDAGQYVLESETITLVDERLKSLWGPVVYRMVLKPKAPALHGALRLYMKRLKEESV